MIGHHETCGICHVSGPCPHNAIVLPDDGLAEGAELAALRKPSAWRGASRGALDYWPQAEKLHRMVDELRSGIIEAETRADMQDFYAKDLADNLDAYELQHVALVKERDEMRAKLAEAEKAMADIFTLAMENGNALRAAGQRAEAADSENARLRNEMDVIRRTHTGGYILSAALKKP